MFISASYLIFFQVRRVAMAEGRERERLAEKVSAWGCVDYLEKTERYKDLPQVKSGYEAMARRLGTYDPELLKAIKQERAKGKRDWFGTSIGRLGKQISRQHEDFETVYHLVSAQLHGSWDVTLYVTKPKPGVLDFREYPDRQTLCQWTAQSIRQATQLCLNLWNEVADATGAPRVDVTS